MSMQTPAARVRGLGSAKSGTEHWWQQRLTAIGLALLAPFFLIPFAMKVGAPWDEVIDFYRHPFNAIVAGLFVLVAFRHMALGLQVVIEDYVGNHGWRLGAVIAVKLVAGLMAFAAVFALVMIAAG